jgi:SAM-dependent methyltransferase
VSVSGADTFSTSMEAAGNYNRWVAGRFAAYAGRAILEVGIGHGGYRRFFPDATRYVGIDIDAAMVERARAAYPRDTFRVVDAADPKFVAETGGGFDSVLCVNVLEHIEDDRTAAANMIAALRPGGHLFLFVPAFGFLYNDLDRLAGHVRRYTKSRLRDALPAEAEVIQLAYFNPVGAVGWWANNFVKHGSLETREVTSQVALFDRWLVPVSRAVDPVTRGFFGQSVVCVARRPG